MVYYDCFAGISGDMNLGALVDLGVDGAYLRSELEKLHIDGFQLELSHDIRRGISGTKATVKVINPDNEKHRHLHHIETLVQQSSLSEAVKNKALRIFNHIAEAEAKVHNISVQQVHFHEVGALDSIVDIVGAAICLDYLKVDRVLSSPIELGGGMVQCAHGLMPVPAPATAEIVKNIPVRTGLVSHEATTPTGAAILAEIVDEFTAHFSFSPTRVGYGIGQRDVSSVPNVLRVYLVEESASEESFVEGALMVECNIDDMNPEWYDYLFNRLFEAGASDVFITPIVMKKSRSANRLSVLCPLNLVATIKSLIFTNTTTIGVREYPVQKTMLRREARTVNTPLGPVQIKVSYFEGKELRSKPEMNEVQRLATEHKLSLAEVEAMIKKSLTWI